MRQQLLTRRGALSSSKISAPPVGGLSVDRATMLAIGGTILREDTSEQADPLTGLWGELAAQSPSRHVHQTSGGDPGLKADGTSQGNASYRELTVLDGDAWQGETPERCELGRNTCTPYYTVCAPGSTAGTFYIYREGDERITFYSQRYHDNFDMTTLNTFQLVMQMKQNQPYLANGPVDTAPALEADIYYGAIHFSNFQTQKWSTVLPPKNTWIRWAIHAKYSKDPNIGWVKVYVDVDGDGNFLDANEYSGQINCQTLANCTSADPAKVAQGGVAVGDPIPSHLRMGIYHRQTYGPTTMDIDNVQVVG